MNIGFDLDKVFIDYPPLVSARLIDKLYKKKDNGVLLYRIPNRPEQIFRKVTHLPVFRSPIKNNLEILKQIPKKNNKLYLISSRFKFLEPETERVIKRFKFDQIFDGMYFNFDNKQPHEFKSEVLQKLNLDMYIDDDLSLIKYVSKHNPKTKFFWLDHTGDTRAYGKNIKAISTLSEIFAK